MTLQQLLAARDALAREANVALDAALAAAQAEGRALNDAEQAAQKGFNDRLAALDSQIAAARLRDERAATIGAAPAVPDAGAVRLAAQVGPPNIQRDPLRGFRDTGDFALAVHRACAPMGGVDPRLIQGGLVRDPATAFNAAPPAGGYHQESGTVEGAMVPPQISQAIWALVFNDPLLDLITVEPTNSNAVEIYGDETTPWGATGVVAKWRSEASQLQPSKLDTKAKLTKLHELYAFVLATDELLQDLPRLTDRLNVKAPAAIRWKFAEAIMFGTGAGQPLGWADTNYAGKLLHARTTAGQIKPDDIVKMFSRLLVADGPDRSFWATNRDTIPDLVLRSIVGNVPVWMPPSGLAGAPNGTIMGRPVFFSEHCQTLGTAGDLQLVNPDGYYATQRGPARADSSIHLYFDYAITAFRWIFRLGGQPLLSALVQPAKGANTKSHFVVLNT